MEMGYTEKREFDAGNGQLIVLYVPFDNSNEVDPGAFYYEIAEDAKEYGQRGLRIVAMSSSPLRHAGAFLGREGSGYVTKVCVTVVYASSN